MSTPAHLANAARTLELILRELHPERHWVVSVRERELADGDHAVDGDGNDARAVADDTHAVRDGTDAPATAGPLDEDALDQAA